MEKLIFDSGIKEYRINGKGVLRFNPCDPNVYARFMDAMEQIRDVEQELAAKARGIEESDGAAVLRLMQLADRKTKDILSAVFGEGNDFDKLLGGVNLLAVAGNGERVITNLLGALQPILTEGAQRCAEQQADQAVAEAKKNRAMRRAKA